MHMLVSQRGVDQSQQDDRGVEGNPVASCAEAGARRRPRPSISHAPRRGCGRARRVQYAQAGATGCGKCCPYPYRGRAAHRRDHEVPHKAARRRSHESTKRSRSAKSGSTAVPPR